jgi:hypothetical protein
MKKPVFLILLCFGVQAQAPHRCGLEPSESDPRLDQQIVYAVASETFGDANLS